MEEGAGTTESPSRACKRCASTAPWHSASLFCGPCREHIRAEALCPRCGEHPLGDRKRYCAQCLERDTEKQREKKRLHREENPSKKPPCRGCQAPHSWSSRSFYCHTCRDDLKARRVCQRCGDNPLMENGRFCRPCQDADVAKGKDRITANRSRGLCYCGAEPLEGQALCVSCKETMTRARRATQARSKAKGRCSSCHRRPAALGVTVCTPCSEISRCHNALLRLTMMAGYGGVCACCGETGQRFLEVDHVTNTWEKGERPPSENGPSLYRRLVDEGFPSGYQVLCTNCNWSKRLHGKCGLPHGAAPRTPWEEVVLQKDSDSARSSVRLRMKVLTEYGGKCACCGETELEVLTIDHVDGGGKAEYRLLGGSNALYRDLRRRGYPSGYQVLCRGCNKGKHLAGTCPHGHPEGPETVAEAVERVRAERALIDEELRASTVEVRVAGDPDASGSPDPEEEHDRQDR